MNSRFKTEELKVIRLFCLCRPIKVEIHPSNSACLVSRRHKSGASAEEPQLSIKDTTEHKTEKNTTRAADAVTNSVSGSFREFEDST